MILEVHKAAGSFVDELAIECRHPPRVGEVIVVEDYRDKLEGMIYLLVKEIVHQVADGKITPYVECHASASIPDA